MTEPLGLKLRHARRQTAPIHGQQSRPAIVAQTALSFSKKLIKYHDLARHHETFRVNIPPFEASIAIIQISTIRHNYFQYKPQDQSSNAKAATSTSRKTITSLG